MNYAVLIKIGKYLLDGLFFKKSRETKRLDRYSLAILQGLMANSALHDVSQTVLSGWAIAQAKELMEQLDGKRKP